VSSVNSTCGCYPKGRGIKGERNRDRVSFDVIFFIFIFILSIYGIAGIDEDVNCYMRGRIWGKWFLFLILFF